MSMRRHPGGFKSLVLPITFNDSQPSFDFVGPVAHHRPMNRRRSLRLTASEDTLKNKDDVTHLLILRFQKMLSDGVLSPGTKLPPERDLAAHFKVARSSLRQALKVL